MKYKGYSLINIMSLALGMTVCLIVFLFVQYELSYDTWFDDADKIYRIAYRNLDASGAPSLAITPVPLAEALRSELKNIGETTKLTRGGNILVSSSEYQSNESSFFFADQYFFNVFSANFLFGNALSALVRPYSVVITQTTALRYFNTSDAIGKQIRVENNEMYTVTGVIDDYPSNTHFRFDFLSSFSSLPQANTRSWLNKNVYTYARLREGVAFSQFEKSIREIAQFWTNARISTTDSIPVQTQKESARDLSYFVQPITRIYLWSNLDYEIDSSGDVRYIYIFSIAGAGILVIACFNFMSLLTARYSSRFKEIGLRKALGATRGQMMIRFVTETFLLCGIAFILSMSLTELLLPLVNFFTGLDLAFASLFRARSLIFMITLLLFVSLVAASYPAIYFSSFNPIEVIKGRLSTGTFHSIIRRVFSLLQLFGLISLLFGTLVIYSQLGYLSEDKFAKSDESFIVLPRAYLLQKQLNSFKEKVKNHPDVRGVSLSRDIPGEATPIIGFKLNSEKSEERYGLNVFKADREFFGTFNISIIQGELFSANHDPSGVSPACVNQSATIAFGWSRPIGMTLSYFDPVELSEQNFKVVCVINDFHFESLRRFVHPVIVIPPQSGDIRYLSVKTSLESTSDLLSYIETIWNEWNPNRPFEYFFLEEDLSRQYYPEHRVGQVFIGFTLLLIIIACLGLIGLIAYGVERRQLELGIRKVVGATFGNIVWEVSKEIMLLVIVATILAWPFATIVMSYWLGQFAYHVTISWKLYLITGIFAGSVVVVTILYHVFKVAMSKPIELIRGR